MESNGGIRRQRFSFESEAETPVPHDAMELRNAQAPAQLTTGQPILEAYDGLPVELDSTEIPRPSTSNTIRATIPSNIPPSIPSPTRDVVTPVAPTEEIEEVWETVPAEIWEETSDSVRDHAPQEEVWETIPSDLLNDAFSTAGEHPTNEVWERDLLSMYESLTVEHWESADKEREMRMGGREMDEETLARLEGQKFIMPKDLPPPSSPPSSIRTLTVQPLRLSPPRRKPVPSRIPSAPPASEPPMSNVARSGSTEGTRAEPERYLSWRPDVKVRTESTPVPAYSNMPMSPQRSTIAMSEEDTDREAPPAYEQMLGDEQRNVSTAVLNNGRISMMFRGQGHDFTTLPPLPSYEPSIERAMSAASHSYPLLNICIQVVGSRGDVQPFVALGQELQQVGHRVRLATHPTFEDFVRGAGLEFFDIGGDPSDLMAYMVKNPGIIPKFGTIRGGEIAKKRKMVGEMLEGCWRSCIDADAVTGVPFVAEAIIANPPSFAHMHCAQALGIPVHLMFTMPWSATRAFPHPLANIQQSDTDAKTTNFFSYGLVDMMTWQGLGDIINHFRKKALNLEGLPIMVGSSLAEQLEVPFTYCWSPALIAKPFDWPSHIDVCGFFFRNAPDYTPPDDIADFLKAGSRPIYIGFGSIVMEDAHAVTRTIMEAVRQCGVRAIVSEGWSKLGSNIAESHPDVLFIGDCPHEWLFKQVSAVIHHGGAGTTACGLLNGRPTAIVPFFGDQPFWGNMVAAAGAGPRPIGHKYLTLETLSQAIEFLLAPSTMEAAGRIALKMQHENGVKEAVKSFHRNLPVDTLNCDMLTSHPATWYWKRGKRILKLSHRAASILVEKKRIEASTLKLYKSKPITIENKRWDPITGTTSAFIESISNVSDAFGSFDSPLKEYRRVKTMEREMSQSTTPSLSPSSTFNSISSGSSRPVSPASASTSISSRSIYASSHSTSSSSTLTSHSQSTALTLTRSISPLSSNPTSESLSIYSASTRRPPPSITSSSTALTRPSSSTTLTQWMPQPQPRPASPTPSTTSSSSSTKTKLPKHTSANKAAANAVGRGFGKVGMALTKGAIDLPRAVADGLHNVPALYGDKVRDYGEIRGWKSGVVTGAKSLGYGFYDGYVGFFSQPYRGARDDGALGLMKGIVKGSMGLLTQPGHAIFGVVAYPMLGLYKQINVGSVSGAQGEILRAQRSYGLWLAERGGLRRVREGERGGEEGDMGGGGQGEGVGKEEEERVVREFEDKWLRVREPES